MAAITFGVKRNSSGDEKLDAVAIAGEKLTSAIAYDPAGGVPDDLKRWINGGCGEITQQTSARLVAMSLHQRKKIKLSKPEMELCARTLWNKAESLERALDRANRQAFEHAALMTELETVGDVCVGGVPVNLRGAKDAWEVVARIVGHPAVEARRAGEQQQQQQQQQQH